MKWKRKKVFKSLLVFLLCLFSFFLWVPWTKKDNLHVLQQLSQQERTDLTTLCEHLIKNTEFGYTLFGTKPVSCLALEEGSFCDKSRLLFARVLPALAKISHGIKLRKYIFTFSKWHHCIQVAFVNKDAFSKAILENRQFFELGGVSIKSPEKLLARLSSDGDFDEIVCKNNEVLFGICLGYGAHNALHFARKAGLGDYFRHQGMPPWNYQKNVFSEKQTKFLGLDTMYVDEGHPFIPCPPPKKMIPFRGFISLEEEVEYLRQVLHPSTHWVPEEMAYVQIPQFSCVSTSQETQTLLKKYKEEQKQLKTILCSNNLLEQVFAKLTEE